MTPSKAAVEAATDIAKVYDTWIPSERVHGMARIIDRHARSAEVINLLRQLLPDYHAEDDGGHGGLIAGEFTWKDVRDMRALLATLSNED